MGPDQRRQQKWLSRIAIGGILACAYVAARGQSGVQPPPTTTYTLPVQVDRVLVPAVVRDKDGHVVNDLQEQDFRVLDDGKPRDITGFLVEKTNPAAGMPVSPTPAAGLPPGQTQPTNPRFTLLLFDDLHLNAEQLARAKKAAAELLARMPLDRDYAAVASLSGYTHSNFVHDRAQLEKTLKQVKVHDLIGRGSTLCPKMDYYQAYQYLVVQNLAVAQELVQQTKYCMRNFSSPSDANLALTPGAQQTSGAQQNPANGIDQEAQLLGLRRDQQPVAERLVEATATGVLAEGKMDVQNSFSQLTASVNAMADLPGPRLLILVSPGFFTGTQDGENQESQLIDTADKHEVIISALDPRGVNSGGQLFRASQGPMPDTMQGATDASQGATPDPAQVYSAWQ